MIRVLVAPQHLVAGTSVALSPEEAHHLQVRRVAENAPLTALDTRGVVATGRAARNGKEWRILVEEAVLIPTPPDTVLVVGAGDRDRFAQAVEKCTELGVTHIIPLETERSLQVATRLRQSGLEKVRRIAAESCKQSGNAWAPAVADVIRFEDFLVNAPQARWLLAAPNGGPCPAIATEEVVGWLVGPEGGFTDLERAALHRVLSTTPVGLGPHMLRFETAATAAAMLTLDRRQHD